MDIYMLITVLVSPLLGIGAYYFLSTKKGDTVTKDAPVSEDMPDVTKQAIVVEARAKAKELIIEARDKALKVKADAEKEAFQIKQEASKKEKMLDRKETELKVLEKDIANKSNDVNQLQASVKEKLEVVSSAAQKKQEELQKVASLTREEARKELMKVFDKELAEEKSKRIREIEEDIKKNKEELAQEILIGAMRHGATDYVVQHTTSKVKLPEEEIKGRIIGKEGRNILKFEELTGVELDLDSSPGDVIISSFDPVRREVAKVALERLIADGRIQPSRIEEIVADTTKEIDHLIFKEGDNLCHRVGVYDIPKDLVQMLGRFKYRFSYGQNMIEHTLEETRIGVAIAHELKADVEVVKLGCLFHDIGKIVSDEEGTHVELGVDLLKKYKIATPVVNAVAEHHEDRPFSSIESAIVALADHVSGARPGARSEDYEAYIERMKSLEDTASSFDGVDKAFAISAGREVRVFVKPERVDDESTALIAREIAKKIELEQTYPGVVKVTVIRETRVSETAR
jgi:ribonuclease Y